MEARQVRTTPSSQAAREVPALSEDGLRGADQKPAGMRTVVACIMFAIAFGAAPASAAPRVISFIGDSATSALYSPPGYPVLVGKILGVKIHNLAVKYPPSYNIIQALQEELPHVPADTTDVVLFLGVDDLASLANKDRPLAAVEAANAEIVATLRARKIRVYQLTIRDYTQDPMFFPRPYDRPTMPRIRYFVHELNASFRKNPDVTIVEAPSWSDVYAGKWSTDGIHFGPQALRRFARHVADALRDH